MRPLSRLSTILSTTSIVAMLALSTAQAEAAKTNAEAISMPDKVNTAIGALEFFDGVPSDATIDKLYDNLDRMRGVEVYLNNSGAASLNAMRAGNASIGADSSNKITITEQLLKPFQKLYPYGL